MIRYFLFLAVSAMLLAACSSGSGPVTPGPDSATDYISGNAAQAADGGRALLGYYEWVIDLEKETIESLPIRNTLIHYNVVCDMNSEPPNIDFEGFTIDKPNNTISLDVHLYHPYPARPNLAGFDVHGIMIGSGSLTGFNDPTIRIAGPNDPHIINPDGWTRWWNPVEFDIGDGLNSYVDGDLGIKNSVGNYNATLNAYKTFSADLGNKEDIWDLNIPDRLIFTTDATHTRHYKVWFPMQDDNFIIRYNYAIDASWAPIPGYQFGDEVDLPSDWDETANQAEPFMIVTDEMINSLYYEDTSVKGGTAVIQVKVYDWQGYLTDGCVSDQIESVMFESPGFYNGVEFASLTDHGSGSLPYATYELILDGSKLTASGDLYGLFTVVSANGDYQPDLTNYSGTAPLSYYNFIGIGGISPTYVPDNNPPEAIASIITGDPIYVGDIVEFDASGSSDPEGSELVYEWDFDNNGIFGDAFYGGSSESPTTIFGWAGDFQIDLKVTDESGASDTLDEKILVTVLEDPNQSPVAVAFALNTEIPIGELAAFNGSFSYDPDGYITAWEWDFDNDGVFGDSYHSGTDQMPMVLFDYGGQYMVSLRVTDNQGAQDTLSTGEIVVINMIDPENQPPVAIGTVDQLEIELGEISIFNGSYSYDSDGSIFLYEWDFDNDGIFGDGFDSGTDQMPEVEFQAAGVYQVNLRVTDDIGAMDTLDEVLIITVNEGPIDPPNEPPVAIAYAPDPVVEQNELVVFNATDSFDPDGIIVAWEWDFNNDGIFGDPYNSGTDQIPLVSFTDVGLHTINLRVTDNDGAMDTLDLEVAIEVTEHFNDGPIAVAGVCKNWAWTGQQVVFHGQFSYDPDGVIVDWEWDFDGDGIYGDAFIGGTMDKPHFVYGTPGDYIVDLRVTDNEGLTDTLDSPIYIHVK